MVVPMASVVSTEPTFKFRERVCTAIAALYEEELRKEIPTRKAPVLKLVCEGAQVGIIQSILENARTLFQLVSQSQCTLLH